MCIGTRRSSVMLIGLSCCTRVRFPAARSGRGSFFYPYGSAKSVVVTHVSPSRQQTYSPKLLMGHFSGHCALASWREAQSANTKYLIQSTHRVFERHIPSIGLIPVPVWPTAKYGRSTTVGISCIRSAIFDTIYGIWCCRSPIHGG